MVASLKILICTLNFSPELTGIGKYSGEMAAWFSSRGHSVRVITTPPYYPKWRVWDEYRGFRWNKSVWSGVEVIRCPLWVPQSPTAFKRMFHLISFALSSLPVLFLQLFWRPNFILLTEPPFLVAPSILFAAKFSKAKTIIHIQDFEIDAAFGLGLLKGGLLLSVAHYLEKLVLQKFDVISTISEKMIELALKKGCDEDRLILIPNWTNASVSISSLDLKKTLGLPPDKLIILYSGSMGLKQGLEVLADVALLSVKDKFLNTKIHFVFCGEGPALDGLKNGCAELNNVSLIPLQPAEFLPSLLAMADIHLLPQKRNATDLVMPSKLAGMMISGRAILAAANPGTEIANVLSTRGIVVEPENSEELFKGIRLLVGNQALRNNLGVAAREYATKNLNQDSILFKLEQKMQQILVD